MRSNERDTPYSESIHQSLAVAFTIDSHIQSLLPKDTIEWLFEIFSRNCAVYLEPRQPATQNQAYPIDVIIWRHSSDFYNWYRGETRIINGLALRFELFDAVEKLGEASPVPEGNIHYFQRVKQWIWDSFWAASKASDMPVPLKVLVRPVPRLSNDAPHCPTTPEQNAMNTVAKLGNSSLLIDYPSPAAAIPQGHDGLPLYNGGATHRRHQPRDSPQLRGSSSQQTTISSLPAPKVDIDIRLQIDGAGKVTVSYPKYVLCPEIMTKDFFA